MKAIVGFLIPRFGITSLDLGSTIQFLENGEQDSGVEINRYLTKGLRSHDLSKPFV